MSLVSGSPLVSPFLYFTFFTWFSRANIFTCVLFPSFSFYSTMNEHCFRAGLEFQKLEVKCSFHGPLTVHFPHAMMLLSSCAE